MNSLITTTCPMFGLSRTVGHCCFSQCVSYYRAPGEARFFLWAKIDSSLYCFPTKLFKRNEVICHKISLNNLLTIFFKPVTFERYILILALFFEAAMADRNKWSLLTLGNYIWQSSAILHCVLQWLSSLTCRYHNLKECQWMPIIQK